MNRRRLAGAVAVLAALAVMPPGYGTSSCGIDWAETHVGCGSSQERHYPKGFIQTVPKVDEVHP